MWCFPVSRSASLSAVKIGRSGQPVQNEGGRPCTFSGAIRVSSDVGLSPLGLTTAGRAVWSSNSGPYFLINSVIPLIT